MGEGAGVVVLEEYEHAKRRGAKIYAELIGYGLSGDAYHITAPAPDGDGAYRCMTAALKRAGISPARDRLHQRARHLDADGRRDRARRRAAPRRQCRRTHVACRRPSPSIGHLLGAAGAVEAIFSILAMRDGVAPPTINLDNPSVETAIDLVPHQAKKREIDAVLSNSFGFGGTNASLVFRKSPTAQPDASPRVHRFAIFGVIYLNVAHFSRSAVCRPFAIFRANVADSCGIRHSAEFHCADGHRSARKIVQAVSGLGNAIGRPHAGVTCERRRGDRR